MSQAQKSAAIGRRLRTLRAVALAAAAGTGACVAWASAAAADRPPEAERRPVGMPGASDRPELPVSKFELVFQPEHPNLPSVDELCKQAKVTLVRLNEGFAVGGAEEARGTVSIADLNEHLAENGPTNFSIEAVRAVMKAMGDAIIARQLIGVLVTTDEEQVVVDPRDPETGKERWHDQRPQDGDLSLRISIKIAIVTGVRTVAAGDRLDPAEIRVNNPVHERILRGSPLLPRQADPQAERKDLLRRDQIDDYVFNLNRRPGRRVDVALSNASETEPGAVVLDYLVRENKPWILYLQASNTGTKQTNEWRERVGFLHNQFLNADDSLSLDYVTGGFDTTHIFNGSYDFPLSDDGKLRVKAYGAYSEFNASEVGQSDENFTGNSYQAGGELSYNLYQYREVFVDVFAGGRYEHVQVTNKVLNANIRGETDFALFGGGIRAERATEVATTNASASFEFNAADLAGTNQDELQRLGRLGTDREFLLLHFSLEQTFFLEPLLDPDDYAAGKSTLAHEMSFSINAQATPDRVAPTYQRVAGGLYTVRGYDESVTAGDSVVVGSAEYRLHIPRLLEPEDPRAGPFGEEDFRWAPQQPYARPDWDLIFRSFVDVGRTVNTDRRAPAEVDETLLGAGVGLELVYKRNLNVRVDWGVVLEAVGTGRSRNEEGDNRFHIVATLLF